MTARTVTDEQLGQLGRRYHDLFRRVREGTVSIESALAGLQRVIETSINVVTIPFRATAAGLIEHANKEIDLTYLNSDLATWNFIQSEAGKRYEVMTKSFGRSVSTQEVRDFFKTQGFGGNTAAFVAWVTEHKPKGNHASIPEKDNDLWRGPESRVLCAPYFRHGVAGRELGLDGVRDDWDDCWVFVAFREVLPYPLVPEILGPL